MEDHRSRDTSPLAPGARLLVFAFALALIAGMAGAALAGEPAAGPTRCLTDIARSAEIGASIPGIDPGTTLAGPPPNPQIGDQWYWWLFFHVGMPHFEQRLCTVRGRTDHAYVVVEDTQWNVRINQADVDHILERWENESIGPHPDMGIYDINSTHFGIPPDELDNDPRIYIMWFDFGNTSDGFFFWFDEEPDGANLPYRSNECEVIYLNTANGQSPSGDYMISVVAHEFEHMIHWKYDPDEDQWVDEGLGELAMWLYGRPDVISGFNSFPDVNLTLWNGGWADYIKTYLWSLYYYERYGGAQAIYDVVHEPANSILGYDRVLDLWGFTENFEDVFADWVVANYLDEPAIGDGRFGYVGEDLPAFANSATHTTYPIGPVSATVNYWAADYVKFDGSLSGLDFDFDGNDTNRFAVWALEMDPVLMPRVTRVTLDPTQAGGITLPDVGTDYEHAVMVAAGIQSFGGTGYSYNASTGVTAVGGTEVAGIAGPHLLPASPNPFAIGTDIGFELAEAGQVRLRVFDSTGRLLQTLVDGTAGPGSHVAHWNGHDASNRSLADGVYFLRLEAGGSAETARVLLQR